MRSQCTRLFLACLVACTSAFAAPDPAEVLGQIRSAVLDPARSVEVSGLEIDMGLGALHLEQGWLVPARAISGHTAEMTFVGRARFHIEPPDAIEAAQLELFTGQTELDLEIERAVLVVGDPAASAALLDRTAEKQIDETTLKSATELFTGWVAGAERRGIGADAAVFRTTLGDPTHRRYFTAVLESAEHGRFYYLLDPTEPEQVTLGQFVPLDLDDRERRRIQREIRREQKSGRAIQNRLEDLGDWDTWLQTSLRGADGVAQPGSEDFEATRYTIDATLLPGEQRIEAVARVDITAQRDEARTVNFSLFSDLRPSQVKDGAGNALPWFRSDEGLYVLLPDLLSAGAKTQVEVTYSGVILEEVEKGILSNRSTRSWHPHVGTVDRATYDVMLRWPKRLDLLASGRVVERREESGQAIERRLLEVPSFAFSFEVGAFEVVRETVGHVELTVGFSKSTMPEDVGAKKEVLDTLRSALPFFEATFGPYPLDHLTVATIPRGYSQGFLSFLTLSQLLLSRPSVWYFMDAEETPQEERRRRRIETVAHELSHQWWGNKVGWFNYRDQWLSEALAVYSAVHYASSQAKHESLYLGMRADDWKEALQDTTSGGRTLESLGPVVLGARLFSSLSTDAYTAIVYRKGSVVFSMLAAILKQDKMNEMLSELATRVGNRAVDTGTFMKSIGRMSGFDLSTFARQFVYGTGMPEVYYRYSSRKVDGETWNVDGEARMVAPADYRYALHRENGWDVTRERVTTVDVSQWALLVPFQISLRGAEQQADKRGSVARGLGGNLVLRGASTPFSIPIKREPEEFWFDQRGQVLAYFYCENRESKRALVYQAMELEGQAAADLLALALATPLLSEDARARSELSDQEVTRQERLLDSWIHLLLARLQLDRRDTAGAKASLSAAAKLLPNLDKQLYEADRSFLAARLALQEADYDAAFRESRTLSLSFPDQDTDSLGQELRRVRWSDGRVGDGEDYGVLAVAAYETGRLTVSRLAVKEAEKRGADMAPLRELLDAP